jgi:hypothetical protein
MTDGLLLPNGVSQGLLERARSKAKKFIERFLVAGAALQQHGDLICGEGISRSVLERGSGQS